MTYAKLLQRLQQLTPEQLAQDVTVYDVSSDETYAVQDHSVGGEEAPDEVTPAGVLDDGHFYLVRTC